MAGLALYGITYLAGLIFYGQFGVDPAEVGFTREAALAHAGFGLLVCLMVIPLFLIIPPNPLWVLILWLNRRRISAFLRRHAIFMRRTTATVALLVPLVAFWE